MSKETVKTVWVSDEGVITISEEAPVAKTDEQEGPVVLYHSFKPVADDDEDRFIRGLE